MDCTSSENGSERNILAVVSAGVKVDRLSDLLAIHLVDDKVQRLAVTVADLQGLDESEIGCDAVQQVDHDLELAPGIVPVHDVGAVNTATGVSACPEPVN